MQRSKLESYEAILEVLVNKPFTLDNIGYELNMDCTILKQRLKFLIKNSLVEERGSSKKTLYAITERGITVLKTLNFQKYFGKITNKIKVIDEAMDIIHKLKKSEFEKEN